MPIKNSLPRAAFGALLFASRAAFAQSPTADTASRREPLRPQFHFSPARNWMNDPNGLVYASGIYHLFFQQNPDAMQMGAIHWGHATSPDLIHWQQQPTALFPDKLGYVFSGSAVLDAANTSGFGKPGHPALVAIFTNHDPKVEKAGGKNAENQSLAYSLDSGRTWSKYAQNPVLKSPGLPDFRDPKVMWYAPGKKWVMALAIHDHVGFYSSPDLKHWAKESEFGTHRGAHGGVWECPDLFPLTDDAGVTRWVLLVSINPGAPNGGSATQYFVGDFDGRTFTSPQQDTRWVDWGPDDYAGVTYANTGRHRVFVAWMNNWLYGQKVPTRPWRGAMTVARELGVKTVDGSPHLTVQPVRELDRLVAPPTTLGNVTVRRRLDLSKYVRATDGRFRMMLDMPRADDWSIVLANPKGERVTIGYSAKARQFTLDRSRSGNVAFAPGFARVATAPRASDSPSMTVTLLVDSASAELFADGGTTCLTGVYFPHAPLTGVALTAPRPLSIDKLSIGGIRSIWNVP